MHIGFIGQGWIGKNYADDFERRGFSVVRYGLEPEYVGNKEAIAYCDIVFIAVPTPTTPEGFDDSILRAAVGHVGIGKTAVIKSTMVPGTTESIQADYPDRFVKHSPEFLLEVTAAYNAANPDLNIVGIVHETPEHRAAAEQVLKVLPEAPYSVICPARDAEFVKYGHNCLGVFRILFTNLLFDAVQAAGANWDTVKAALAADPWIGDRYLNPVHKNGRGAGGACFIKDFAAFTEVYNRLVQDEKGARILDAIAQKNIELLVQSNKSIELLKGVYGEEAVKG